MKLSLCMIVRDEQLTLERVLKAARQFADEIIVVDTGSKDNTVDIANRYASVFYYKWNDDFSAARNYAFQQASSPYLMWLDADDIIPQKTIDGINKLKSNLNADVIMMPYIVGNLKYSRERIVKKGMKFEGRVHEAITPSGKIETVDLPIIHDKIKNSDPDRNLRILRDIAKQRTLTPRELFYYGSELYYHGNDKCQSVLNEFLSSDGWKSDKGQAALYLSDCATQEEQKRKILMHGLSFVYSPDLLCSLGESFMRSEDYYSAKNAFLAALSADESITFPTPDCANYLPHIRLCRCYWMLGDKKAAKAHNDIALIAKPNDKYALANTNIL